MDRLMEMGGRQLGEYGGQKCEITKTSFVCFLQ